jgi:mRNA-degrading endonuclease toxin of MazEF toxin-antitoxin module
MNICRGDIALARFPHDSGGRGKKRPVVVIQANVYNQQLRHTVVAEITGNLSIAADPANLLVEIGSGDGSQSGLTRDSVVSC